MFDPQHALLSRVLASVVDEVAKDPAALGAWAKADEALAPSRATEMELAAIVDARNAAGLGAIVAEWNAGSRLLPERDRAVLKSALKAFRKTLKLTRLDAESNVGRGPMSGGRHSGIVGIAPPRDFAPHVWEELVRQRRLRVAGRGIYELPPEQTPGE